MLKVSGIRIMVRKAGTPACRSVKSICLMLRNMKTPTITSAGAVAKAGTAPILSRWNVGRGSVYAFTGTPCGEPGNGTAWWAWGGWQAVLDRILEGASPGREQTYEAGTLQEYPVLGRLAGTNDLTMVGGDGRSILPLESEGVQATPQGLSCGYGQGLGAAGVLAYPAGLIRPRGSITFKITPGWDTTLSDLDRSVLLFATQSQKHGGAFQVYVYVHSGGDMALGVGGDAQLLQAQVARVGSAPHGHQHLVIGLPGGLALVFDGHRVALAIGGSLHLDHLGLHAQGVEALLDRAHHHLHQVLIRPPTSRIGPISEQERSVVRSRSPVGNRYDESLDRESAAEVLQKRAEKLAREAEKEQGSEKKKPAKRRTTRQSAGEAAVKSFLRSMSSMLGREIMRGILGAVKRGR